MATAREKKAIKAHAENLRRSLWPEVSEDQLWIRTKAKGYITIPVSISLLMRIMDKLSKGAPVSATYLALWCNTWDNPMLEVKNEKFLAHEAGFSKQRAVATWRQRMKRLVELGFIKVMPGPYGDYSYVLIMHPHLVVKKIKNDGLIKDEGEWTSLMDKAISRKFIADFSD